jgi:hypothetical protein
MRRCFPRLNLSAFLALTLVVGCALGSVIRRADMQRAAVQSLRARGAIVRYDWEWRDEGPIRAAAPWWPGWLEHAMGIDLLSTPVHVLAATPLSEEELRRLGELRGLEHLVLAGAWVDDRSFTFVSELTRLRFLYLESTNVGDDGLKHLERLSELSDLSLGDCRFGQKGALALTHLPNLRSVVLRGPQAGDARQELIRNVLPAVTIIWAPPVTRRQTPFR